MTLPTTNILSEMWLWPEILYHLSDHLTHRDLSRLSLVCHAWNNAFAPILWANITLGSQKLSREGEDTSDCAPSLETLQARASWMRCIVYQGHRDAQQFSLGLQCRYLNSLTLFGFIPFTVTDTTTATTTTAPQYDKTYSDSCRTLIRQNRASLRHLTLTRMTFNAPKNCTGKPNWSPMGMLAYGKHTGLRTLKVEGCYIYGQHREAFWALCKRLEGLTICWAVVGLPGEVINRRKIRDKVGTAIGASASNNSNSNSTTTEQDTGEKWITSKWFPRMMDLKIEAMSEKPVEDYLHCIVAQCPRLRHFEWDAYLDGTSFMYPMMEYLTNPELRATTWPDLECITMDGLFGRDHLLPVIETWPNGKLRNAYDLLSRAPEGVVKRLLDLHSGSLREVDMSRVVGVSPRKWMHRFLELCPMLEKVKCVAINLEPLISEDRPPWVCERLREWEIWVDMDPRSFTPPMTLDNGLERQEEWCRKLFGRLGRLRQLRVLDLRLKSIRNGYYEMFPKKQASLLHLSLRTGLGELSRLSKLKEVYFHAQQTLFRRSDVRWMVEHWINLEVIQGGSFSEKWEPFAGKKKKVWDYEYCRMFGQHHIKASSESGPYPTDYLNPKQLEILAETDDK